MKKLYTDLDQLPIMLNADQLSQVLGISRSGAYQLMHAKDFPAIRIGAKRILVPKDNLIQWLENKLDDKEAGEWQ